MIWNFDDDKYDVPTLQKFDSDRKLHLKLLNLTSNAARSAKIAWGTGGDQMSATAHHESGHAIVAEITGLDPSGVRVFREPGDGIRGRIDLSRPNDDDVQNLLAHGATACAGALAVLMYAGKRADNLGCYSDDGLKLARLTESCSRHGLESESFQGTTERRAAEIIREHRVAIVTLAEQLLANDKVNNFAIREAISNSRRR